MEIVQFHKECREICVKTNFPTFSSFYAFKCFLIFLLFYFLLTNLFEPLLFLFSCFQLSFQDIFSCLMYLYNYCTPPKKSHQNIPLKPACLGSLPKLSNYFSPLFLMVFITLFLFRLLEISVII